MRCAVLRCAVLMRGRPVGACSNRRRSPTAARAPGVHALGTRSAHPACVRLALLLPRCRWCLARGTRATLSMSWRRGSSGRQAENWGAGRRRAGAVCPPLSRSGVCGGSGLQPPPAAPAPSCACQSFHTPVACVCVCSIVDGQERELAKCGKGQCFGELALLERKPRCGVGGAGGQGPGQGPHFSSTPSTVAAAPPPPVPAALNLPSPAPLPSAPQGGHGARGVHRQGAGLHARRLRHAPGQPGRDPQHVAL